MFSNIYIDLTIVILFLAVNLGIGLWYGTGVYSLRDYALGGRKFSTAALTTTILATCVNASGFSLSIYTTYKVGIVSLIIIIGQFTSLLFVNFILIPRMQEFLGKLSLPEVMGNLYGKHIRTISAISSIIILLVAIAVQIKVFSSIFYHFLEINSLYAILIGIIIVLTYTAFGGIRAVVFTDIFQFLTFGAFTLFIWNMFGNWKTIITTLSTNPIFDFNQLLDYHNPIVIRYYGLFFIISFLISTQQCFKEF